MVAEASVHNSTNRHERGANMSIVGGHRGYDRCPARPSDIANLRTHLFRIDGIDGDSLCCASRRLPQPCKHRYVSFFGLICLRTSSAHSYGRISLLPGLFATFPDHNVLKNVC